MVGRMVHPACPTRLLPVAHSSSSDGRTYPAFPIAAVAIVVRHTDIQESPKYLLVKRANEPGKGMWSIPGGVISTGERTIEAAARELYEETSLDSDVVTFAPSPFTSSDAIYGDENGETKFHYVISQTLAYADASAVGQAKAGDDATDAGWFSLADMRDLDPGVVPTMLRTIEQCESMVNTGCLKECEAVRVTVTAET